MNKIQTRIISLLVAITITIGLLPGLKVNAAASGTCGPNLTWTLDDAGTLTITGAGAIAESAFSNNAQVKTVVIEEGITGIGSNAFKGCTSLEKVTVPVSVASIGDYAFADCTALTSFEADATLLQTIDQSKVFANSDKVGLVARTYKITYDTCSFGAVSGPGGAAATDKISLNVSPESGYVVDTVTFTDNKGTTTTITPDSDGKYSFTMPSGEVTVDAAFKQLGANATIVASGYCGDPSVNDGKDVTWTLDDAGVLTISGTGAMADYEIPFYTPWYNDMSNVTSIVISDGVTSIGDSAFWGCNKATNVQIGNGVASIGECSFRDCSSIMNITLPESVQSIGIGAFFGCTGLESINIPAGVTKIEGSTFYSCSNLKSITIPNGVTTIGIYAFNECTSLESVEIPASVTSYDIYAFADCTNLKNVTFADGSTIVGGYEFYGCTSLNSITIPNSVTSIGNGAFYNCTSLTGITIPDRVTSIGNGAFYNCTSLNGITIPDSVTSIGYNAFNNCTSLTGITIPDSVTDIGFNAFKECTSLTRITIPDSVTSIGDSAFFNCTSLTDVTMSKTLYDKLVQNNKLGDVFSGITLPSIHVRYTVDYKSNGNGTITGTTTKSFGTDQIELTIQPDNNYVLDKIEWSDGTNSGVLTESNGKYTMPDSEAGAITITATFKPIQKTVTFKNEDGTVLQSGAVDYGTNPTYTGSTPSKAEDDQYTYTFAGWSDGTKTYGPTDTLPAVTDDATYTAVFDSTVKQYTIKFIDEDGSVLQSGDIDYGTTPVYTGTIPTKSEDDDYTYAFAGWAPTVTSVTGNATYTATFTETAKPTPEPTTPTPAPTTPAPTPEPTPVADEEVPAIVSGIAHVQDVGNVTTYMDPETSFLYLGTEGQGKRLESITLNFENPTSYSGTLEYRVHVQDIGWTDWVTAGNPAGTVGQSKRIEAIEIRLTGELADYYSVFYGVHIQDYGDMQGLVQDGALAGTTGESKRVEALVVVIAPKGMNNNISVQYRVHVQDYGWESSYAADGKMAGTSGQSKRLEGIEMFITGCPYSGGIQYKTHVQDYGWESSWTKNGEMSGTQGQSKRLEGICIELYGEVAEYYDIYYRVHAQDIGWMAWAKNGECAGTAGRSARLEGIQIVLVPKGDPAPGATYEGITAVTDKAFIEGF